MLKKQQVSYTFYIDIQIDDNLHYSGNSLKDVGIIKAEVSDSNSLCEMAKKGKIVLNCVGPYRFVE